MPKGSVRLIGYGKPCNGPISNPTNKPKLEYPYIYGLTEGNYGCDKITYFSYLNSNKSVHYETQIANNCTVINKTTTAKLGSHGRKDITKVMAITNRNEKGDHSNPLRGIGYLDTCKYPA
jgi:hypothetical protein